MRKHAPYLYPLRRVIRGRRVSPALEKTYQFVLWLEPTVEKFPRRQRFLLGDRIQITTLDILEGVGCASRTRTTILFIRQILNFATKIEQM